MGFQSVVRMARAAESPHRLLVFLAASLVRAVAELVAGGYVLLVAWRWQVGGFASLHPDADPVASDRTALFVIGSTLLLLAVVRVVQVVLALRARESGRRAGLVLACLDLLTCVTLPFAFWGLFVYRHADTREAFRRARSPCFRP